MTCIVGIEFEGSVWLGGDSAAVEGTTTFSITDPKVFTLDGIGFGFCGSFRAGQVIKYALQIPTRPVDRDEVGYLVIDLVDAIREVLTSKGTLKSENSVEEIDMSCMIAYNGKLYYMDTDLQINRSPTGYFAVGCGCDLARGALHALMSVDMSPEAKVRCALDASVEWSGGVRGPFTIIRVDPPIIEKKSTNTRKKTKI